MNKSKTYKILCLWDYNSITGFATVSKNIKTELKKHFQGQITFHICAINYFDDPKEEPDGTYVFSALKSAPKRDDFGRYGFLKILKESDEYDGIFILQDLAIISPIIEILESIKKEKKLQNRKNFKSIFYFPVDCPVKDKWVKDLDFFDTLVTYTEYGRSEVLKVNPNLRSKLNVIPHGNNHQDFYPIDENEKKSFRDFYFGKNSSKFIISNINRNQMRKDIPATIFSFLRAKQNCDKELFLYLHMNPDDPMGWKLNEVLAQTDLIQGIDYQILADEYVLNGVPVETLNMIYNSSDLYLTTTLAEGWGLGVTEAFATKTLVLCPLHTSFVEITNNGKRAVGINSLYERVDWKENIVRNSVDYEMTSQLISMIALDYFNFNKTDRIESAYEWVKKLGWQDVCKSWVELFKQTY